MLEGVKRERCVCVCVCVWGGGGGGGKEREERESVCVCSPLQQCLYSLVAIFCVHVRTDGHHTKTGNGV